MAVNTATSWDKALKPIFRDLQSIWYEHVPTVATLKKDTSYEGQKRVIPILTAGSMASSDFNTAKNNRVAITPVAYEIDVVRSYALGSLDNLAVLKSKSDKGSTGRLFKYAIDAAMYAWERRLSSQFWGNGGGMLGQIASGGVATVSGNSVITLADTSRIVFFEEKQIIQLSAADGLTGSVRAGRATIKYVDRDNGKFTIDGLLATAIPAGAALDYIFNDGDFGTSQAAQGLPAWCPADATVAAGTFLGVDCSVDIVRRRGSRFAANGSTIEDAMINAVARHQRNGGRPKQFVLGPLRFAEFQKNALSRGFTMSAVKTDKVDITFKAYELPTAKGSIQVVSDPDCPESTGWLYDKDDWTMFSAGPSPHFDEQSGDKMLVEAGADAKEFRLISYHNFECRNPLNNCAVTF